MSELGSRTTYFSVDHVDFHNNHSDHSVRLSAELNLKPEKIGKYSIGDKLSFLGHSVKHDKERNGTQHSDDSHRVVDYIKEVLTGYTNSGTAIMKSGSFYKGIVSEEILAKQAYEELIKVESVYNKISGMYYHSPNSGVENETSVFKIKASAPYPFLKYTAPNIDFSLKVAVFFNLNSKSVKITVEGSHNEFPAYEWLVNNSVIYNYDPSKKRHTGPTLLNLNQSIDFSSTHYIKIDDVSLNAILNNRNRNLFF